MENKKSIETAEQAINEQIKACNAAFMAGDLKAYNEGLVELSKAEKEYHRLIVGALYADLLTKDNPIVEAIKMYDYVTLGHREVHDKETKKPIGVERVERTRKIDLLDFCQKSKLGTLWQYDVERFNQLLTLRVATDLGLSSSEIKSLASTYYMKKQAQQIEMGKTPTSNTQVCKMLQYVIDQILPDNDDESKPYKCNNYDVSYLRECYSKVGKGKLRVVVAKHAFLRSLITDVMYRIITGGKYEVDYKKVKIDG